MPVSSARRAVLLASGLVEEAAALEQLRSLLGRHLDVSRRQQKHLVGDSLHPAVERVRKSAREVDQPLRQILIRALQVEDDRNRVLELVRDLLRIVEAARHDEVHTHGYGTRYRARPWPQDGGAIALWLRIRPIVELTLSPARGQSPHVRPLGVGALEILVGDVFLVPVVLLGDAEIDERPVPDVRKAHLALHVTPRIGHAGYLGEPLGSPRPLHWSAPRTGAT